MIISITPNPALDVSYFVDDFKIDKAHRVDKMVKTAGGKGINVAKVVNILGGQVICSGFLGGSNGDFIKNSLDLMEIEQDFIKVSGETRSTITINDPVNSTTTEIREKGPEISKEELDEFFERLLSLEKSSEIFTCSGSLPLGLDECFFDQLMENLQGKKLIIDTSEAALRHIVFESKEKPFAIKPNSEEIVQLFGEKYPDKDLVDLLKVDELKDIEIVMISLGSQGALAKIAGKYYECDVPVIKAVNPVGSGDSTIAGMAFALEKQMSPENILKYAMACGVLNALEEKIGHINIDGLEEMISQIIVKEI